MKQLKRVLVLILCTAMMLTCCPCVAIASEYGYDSVAVSGSGKGSGSGIVMLDADPLADFTYEAKVIVRYGNQAGLIFRASTDEGAEGMKGYYLGFFGGELRLLKTDGTDFPYVMDNAGVKSVTRAYARTYRLKVVASGDNFKVYLDDELAFDVTDTDASRVSVMTDAGSFGFRTYNGMADFYDAKISDAEGNVVFAQTDLTDHYTIVSGTWSHAQMPLERYATATASYTCVYSKLSGLNDGTSINWTTWNNSVWNSTASDRNVWAQYEFEDCYVTLDGIWVT